MFFSNEVNEKCESSMKECITGTKTRAELSQLFSESRTEVILQRLVDAVERNECEIKLLQNMQNSWLTRISKDVDTLRDRIINIEGQVSSFQKKSDSLDEALKIPGTPNMTVGEGVAANRRALAKTLNLVANKAESDELARRMAQLQSDVDQKFEKIHASALLIEKLNQSIQALGSRTDVISLDVQNKVDKSLFSSLSSEAEIVRNYSIFVKETEKSMHDIHVNMDQLKSDMLNEKDSARTWMTRTTELESSFKELPSKKDLEIVNEQLSSMLKLVDNKASEKIQKLEQSQLLVDEKITTLENESHTLFSAHETLAKHLTKRLDDMYKKKNIDHLLEKYLQVDSFLDAIRQIVNDVESKASEVSVHELRSVVQRISEEHELTRKKADLSARFIEWYTRNFNSDDGPGS